MSQINPFVGSVGQSPQALKQSADERSRQVRKAHDADHGIETREDEFIHQVGDSGAVSGADQNKDRPQKESKPKLKRESDESEGVTEDPEEHIDLTA